MYGLIVGNNIKKYGGEWASMIVDGTKSIEVRSNACRRLERVAIIEAGTNLILGTVEITGNICFDTSMEWERQKLAHRVNVPLKDLDYAKPFGWLLHNPIKFKTPIPCKNRKLGQVIWVKDALEDDYKE